MRLFLLCVVLALVGCQTCPVTPVVEVQEVKVPVVVKCRVKRPSPPDPYPVGIMSRDTYDKVMAIASKLVATQAYANELLVALNACSEPEEQAARP